MKISITDSEAETLQQILDFAVRKLDARVGATVTNTWDVLAVTIARSKVRALRAKLFPPTQEVPA